MLLIVFFPVGLYCLWDDQINMFIKLPHNMATATTAHHCIVLLYHNVIRTNGQRVFLLINTVKIMSAERDHLVDLATPGWNNVKRTFVSFRTFYMRLGQRSFRGGRVETPFPLLQCLRTHYKRQCEPFSGQNALYCRILHIQYQTFSWRDTEQKSSRCLDPETNFRLARQRSNCFRFTKRPLYLASVLAAWAALRPPAGSSGRWRCVCRMRRLCSDFGMSPPTADMTNERARARVTARLR